VSGSQTRDYGDGPRRQDPSTMTPLSISLLLLVVAFVITAAYMAVDERS
jgi:hypothetical protein